MKRLLPLAALLLSVLHCSVHAQVYSLPAADIQNLEGATINTAGLNNNGKPMIISFWATWCKPCIMELSNIHDEFEELVEETGVKLVAVSIDDMRNVAKVAPFVNGRGWDYEVYCDPNGNFKRALSVNTIPHTFLVDGAGNIVWQHNAYAPGDEDKLFALVRLLAAGKPIPTDNK